jgi:hypothetical protein
MIKFRQKEYTIGSVAATGLTNLAHGASLGIGGLLAGGAKAAAGLGQLGAAGLAKGAVLAVSHPIAAGALALYGIHRLLKRRRERRAQERGYSVIDKMWESGYFEKRFAETVADPELGYKEREVVPKKIARKAEKKGVVQQDSQGRWRIINMNGPGGQPVYWKPIYKSRESAENCLRAYQSGRWTKK